MDKVKINKAIDGLGLSVDNKNTLKKLLIKIMELILLK